MSLFTTHKDAVDVEDFGLAAVLHYLGYPLTEMSRPPEPPGAKVTFTFLVPALDYHDIVKEYHDETLPLSSAKKLVGAFFDLHKRIRELRLNNRGGVGVKTFTRSRS
jgi:hypothetical protein